MTKICFNCGNNVKDSYPICPHCFVVQKEQNSREDVLEYLEIYLPTKPKIKEKTVSTSVIVEQRDYIDWLLLGIFTLGIAYYYYLLQTLKDMNKHWLFPHGDYEDTTHSDTVTATILLVVTSFIGVPFIQYMRYEKLNRHIQKAPYIPGITTPPKGKRMFWLYLVNNILFLGSANLVFFGVSALVVDFLFEFESIYVGIIILVGAGIFIILMIILTIAIVVIERSWQNTFNTHIEWHNEIISEYEHEIPLPVTEEVR